MKLPNFSFEKRLWKKGIKIIVGLDEVGRGAFAGPLVVGAVVYKKGFKITKEVRINDSKKLTKLQREKADRWIRKNALGYAICEISAKRVDSWGISKMTYSGFRGVVKTLQDRIGTRVDYLLIDAIYIPYTRGLPVAQKQQAIIHGDARSFTIASASIVAKVYRDKLMAALGKRYKKYHWDQNKGYGTLKHRKSIKKFGLTKYHRRTFVHFLN